MDKEIVQLFRDILLICDDQGLIGKEMFAIDGCKLPSNASKEWSGTKADFEKKAAKMETAISGILKRHRENDHTKTDKEIIAKEEKYIKKLRKRVKKIRGWLSENDDKIGKSGKPIKSNITDNESAKMKTSKGVIQGYDGVTAVNGKTSSCLDRFTLRGKRKVNAQWNLFCIIHNMKKIQRYGPGFA
jgi:hypothetical protein